MEAQVSERVQEKLAVLIRSVAEEAAALGEGGRPIVRRLSQLERRLTKERFQLAVLGQFKRGKSTLLNALLGEEILPTSVLPLTAIPTYISWGEKRSATVHFEGSRVPERIETDDPTVLRGFLSRYVTEKENPENRREVDRVEVKHPAAILARGVVLIDTPGIGSTLRHNTTTTLSFLPQCDAALFVTASDPPITEVEAKFLESVQAHVARLFIVLNKIDHLDSTEQEEAVRFLEGELSDHLVRTPKIIPVSARRGLNARITQDAVGWEESGMSVLERHLTDFLIHDKEQAFAHAAAQKGAGLADEAILQLDLSIRSLSLPFFSLEEKLAVFQKTIEDVKHERQIAADLLRGERRRLLEHLEEQAERLRREAKEYLIGVLDKGLKKTTNENTLRKEVASVIPGFFTSHCDALAKGFAERVAATLRPHQERAEVLTERLRRSAAELFDVPYQPASSSSEFKLAQRPYWVTRTYSTSFIPNPMRLVDRLVPMRVRTERIRARLAEEIETLVLHNVENLRVTTRESLERTLREFTSQLNARFDETLAATQGAIDAAVRKREEAGDVSTEIARLERIKARILRLKERLEEPVE